MKAAERPRLDDGPTERVFRYVERRGAVDAERVREALALDVQTFYETLAALAREGYLAEEDGRLRVPLDAGGTETYAVEGLQYTVRPARQEDFEGIVKAMRRIADERTYVVAETVAEQLLYEDAVVRHNYATSRLFFVATVDGAVVGWTHLDTSPIEKLRHTARQTIGVLEPYRGYGVGGRLVDRGLEWAADNGVTKLYNSLPATNAGAIEFLESHGAEVDAVRRDHYRIDGEYVDEVMMAIRLEDVETPEAGVLGEPGRPPEPPGDGREASTAESAWENAVVQMRRALAADDPAARRFHVRQGLQFVALGLDD